MLGYGVGSAGRPGAIAMTTQVERVNVIVAAKVARHPIPVAGMIERAMHEQQGGLAFTAPVPELQAQSMRIEKMGNWLKQEETLLSLQQIFPPPLFQPLNYLRDILGTIPAGD